MVYIQRKVKKMEETMFALVAGGFVLGFFAWGLWVLNPKHPERLERLRAKYAPRDDTREILCTARREGDLRAIPVVAEAQAAWDRELSEEEILAIIKEYAPEIRRTLDEANANDAPIVAEAMATWERDGKL